MNAGNSNKVIENTRKEEYSITSIPTFKKRNEMQERLFTG